MRRLLLVVVLAVASTACGPPRPVAGHRAVTAASRRPPSRPTPPSSTVSTATPCWCGWATARSLARLLGIDTPETVHPERPVECFGPEASARTAALVPPGTAVRLERDVEARDRYDRVLVYVFRAADGLFVNRALVEEGYARTLWIPPEPGVPRRAGGGRGRRPRRRSRPVGGVRVARPPARSQYGDTSLAPMATVAHADASAVKADTRS